MKSIKIILLSCIALYFMACDKYPDYCKGGMDFEFDLPVSVNPATDTIQLGDTLWVEMRIDNPILNKLDGKRYDISKADLFMYFYIQDILQPVMVPTNQYYRLDENGNYLSNTNPDGDDGDKVILKVDGGQCYWKRGFVITQKGLYMLSFTDDIGRSTQPHITECPNEEVEFKYTFNNAVNSEEKHFDLLQYSHDESVRRWTSDLFLQSSHYAICVN